MNPIKASECACNNGSLQAREVPNDYEKESEKLLRLASLRGPVVWQIECRVCGWRALGETEEEVTKTWNDVMKIHRALKLWIDGSPR